MDADCLSGSSSSPSFVDILTNEGYRCYLISTGGAAMNAMMNTDTAVNKVGIIKTPNQPMYKRFSVEVTHSQKRAHSEVDSRLSKIAVIKN